MKVYIVYHLLIEGFLDLQKKEKLGLSGISVTAI